MYALKQLSKAHVLDSENGENVMREKEVMCMVSHWSVMGVVDTFKDPKHIYFLMKAVLGDHPSAPHNSSSEPALTRRGSCNSSEPVQVRDGTGLDQDFLMCKL